MKSVQATTLYVKNVLNFHSDKKYSITLNDFILNYYLPSIQVRKKSWKIDKRIYEKHIALVFGHKKLSKIKSYEVENWLDYLLNCGLKPSTCNRILAVFKTICTATEKAGVYSFGMSPCRNVAAIKNHIHRERYLSKNEAKRLMEELKKNSCLESYAIRLLLLTGARKNEILKAKWEDIDFNLHFLIVPLSKSGNPRHIVLSDEAIRLIRSIPRKKESPYLFPSTTKNKPLSDIYIFWNRLRKQLGLENVRIHDLRHTFASFLVNAGYSLYEVQKLLGHSDPRITMRYAHLEREKLIKATEAVSSLVI